MQLYLASVGYVSNTHTHAHAKEILTKDHRQIDKTEIIRKVQKKKKDSTRNNHSNEEHEQIYCYHSFYFQSNFCRRTSHTKFQ